ncbi:MAG: PAS domain-containing protein [Candidatus Omnitrophota bacterium]|jgi:PAS domain S-box-containing protein
MARKDKTKEELTEEIRLLQKRITELEAVCGEQNEHTGKLEAAVRDSKVCDAAELTLAATRFNESEKRFLDVFYASEDAILLIDGNIFVDCNEATAKMLGYSTRKAFLMSHPSQLSPDIQPDGQKSFEKSEEMIKIALEKGYNRFEWMHRKANGTDFLVEVSLTPISLHGKIVIHCLWRDLTEAKKLEALEYKHLKELEIFYKAAIGREERIVDLKKEVDRLNEDQGNNKK